jgi:hypothetical protein
VNNRKYSLREISHAFLLSSLLLMVFMTYANKVDDLDLWWHLKQGQLIYETHEIPHRDLFSFTTEIPKDVSGIGKKEAQPSELPAENTNRYWSTSIRRNWLSQFLLYLTYLIAGFKGIGILKSATFVVAYTALYVSMIKRGADKLIAFLILSLVALIGTDFNYTRPQIFSFLLFSGMLYTLYDFRKGGRSIYFLPLLMLIWSNLHGGFILGVLMIFAFTFGELIKYLLHPSSGMAGMPSLNKNQIKRLGLIAAVSAIASLVNPNSYKAFLFPVIQEKSIFRSIEEYSRPMLYEYHAYWFMLALTIVAIAILIKKKRLDLTELFLSLIVILPSVKGIRYILFFALGTGVFLAHALTVISSGMKDRKPLSFFDRSRLSKIGLKGALTLLLTVSVVVILIRLGTTGRVLAFDVQERRYPSGAAAFIQQNKVSGKMFNPYNWGGYLIWRLYPDYKVFMYGRTLNETAFFHYAQILKASPGNVPGSPLWKRLLDAYEVNFILTSAVNSTGGIVPLVGVLYTDSDWHLVYSDGKSMIFLKYSEENQGILHQYHISKERVFDEIISECKQGIAEFPATWGYYETLGYVYMKQNRINEAIAMFEKYLSMNPYNAQLKTSYELLKRYSAQSGNQKTGP